jgi:hypothetical protein
VIRITTHQDKSRTVVIIDGRLAAADLEEVHRVRQSLPGNVSLDLGGLDACAEEGLKLLREWVKNGARLLKAPPFLRMVLEGANGRSPLTET